MLLLVRSSNLLVSNNSFVFKGRLPVSLVDVAVWTVSSLWLDATGPNKSPVFALHVD